MVNLHQQDEDLTHQSGHPLFSLAIRIANITATILNIIGIRDHLVEGYLAFESSVQYNP
jgi:hypothetical protein